MKFNKEGMVNRYNLGMVIRKIMVKVINSRVGKVSHNIEVEAINYKGGVVVNNNNHLEDMVEIMVHFT